MPINWDTRPRRRHERGGDARAAARALPAAAQPDRGGRPRDARGCSRARSRSSSIETPSGTAVFDWTVPREWTIRGAFIEGPDGTRGPRPRRLDRCTCSATARRSTSTVELAELREHVFTHPDDPDLVPYRTSYWQEQWGFCMSRRQLDSLPRRPYRVVIDSTLADGSLTSGELRHRGRAARRSSCSAPTSAIRRSRTTTSRASSLLWALARPLAAAGAPLHLPPPLEPGDARAALLARPQPRDARPGRARPRDLAASAIPARSATSAAGAARGDRPGRRPTCSAPRAGRDRQRLGAARRRRAPVLLARVRPAGRHVLTRTPHGLFPEYHSSADNLELVSAAALGDALRAALELIDLVETNAVYENRSPFGEPQLGGAASTRPCRTGRTPRPRSSGRSASPTVSTTCSRSPNGRACPSRRSGRPRRRSSATACSNGCRSGLSARRGTPREPVGRESAATATPTLPPSAPGPRARRR